MADLKIGDSPESLPDIIPVFPWEMKYEGRVSGLTDAERVYGKGRVKGILKRKAREYLLRRKNIPRSVVRHIPSYNIEDWKKESNVYDYKGRYSWSVGGVNFSRGGRDRPDIYLLEPKGTPQKLKDKVLEHELVHSTISESRRKNRGLLPWPLTPKLSYGDKRRSDAHVLSEAAEYNSSLGWRERTRRTKEASEFSPEPKYDKKMHDLVAEKIGRESAEIVPWTTRAVRAFYEKTGREIETPEEVQRGFDFMMEGMGASEDYRFIIDYIRTKPYINDLGMMLVKNKIKKPATIGAGITIKRVA